MTGYIDLVLDNGELVRIEYPDKHEDELLCSRAFSLVLEARQRVTVLRLHAAGMGRKRKTTGK